MRNWTKFQFRARLVPIDLLFFHQGIRAEPPENEAERIVSLSRCAAVGTFRRRRFQCTRGLSCNRGVNTAVTRQAIMQKTGNPLYKNSSNRQKPTEEHKTKRLTKTEKRLLRRIIKRTTDDDQLWVETNTHVAKSLGVNRSTIVRSIDKLKKHGILCPAETKGGRGIPSSYIVDRAKAKELLRTEHWPPLPSKSDPGKNRGDSLNLPNWVPTNTEAIESSRVQTAILLSYPQAGCVAQGDWKELMQEVGKWARRAVYQLGRNVIEIVQNPTTWISLGFLGLTVLDLWAIYTVWRKGPRAALLTAVPLGAATYGYWKIAEFRSPAGQNQMHPTPR